jgi:hypothetical protein
MKNIQFRLHKELLFDYSLPTLGKYFSALALNENEGFCIVTILEEKLKDAFTGELEELLNSLIELYVE